MHDHFTIDGVPAALLDVFGLTLLPCGEACFLRVVSFAFGPQLQLSVSKLALVQCHDSDP